MYILHLLDWSLVAGLMYFPSLHIKQALLVQQQGSGHATKGTRLKVKLALSDIIYLKRMRRKHRFSIHGPGPQHNGCLLHCSTSWIQSAGYIFSSIIYSVNLQGYLKSLWSLRVRKCEWFPSVPANEMIKPLKRFITATPLGALMSLTRGHPLQCASLSISSTNAPSVILLCCVCYWSWVNKWVFLG